MELLLELLNDSAPFKLQQFPHGFGAFFKHNDNSYVMEADEDIGGERLQRQIEEYGNEGDIESMDPKWFDEDETYHVLTFKDENADDEWEMTNRGDALRILSTVMEFVKQITDKGVERIYFSAADDSPARSRVYERMFKRVASSNIVTYSHAGDKHFFIDV